MNTQSLTRRERVRLALNHQEPDRLPIDCGAMRSTGIQAILCQITERQGCLDLGFLENLSDADARGWLESLDGVGPKTAACVLMFSLGRLIREVRRNVPAAKSLMVSMSFSVTSSDETDRRSSLPSSPLSAK